MIQLKDTFVSNLKTIENLLIVYIHKQKNSIFV